MAGAIPILTSSASVFSGVLGGIASFSLGFLCVGTSSAAAISLKPIRHSGKLLFVLKENPPFEVNAQFLIDAFEDEEIIQIQYCQYPKTLTEKGIQICTHDFIMAQAKNKQWYRFEKSNDALYVSKLTHREQGLPIGKEVLKQYSTRKTLHDCLTYIDLYEYGKRFVLATNNCKHFARRFFQFCTSGCILYKKSADQEIEADKQKLCDQIENLKIDFIQLLTSGKRFCVLFLCEGQQAFELERTEDGILVLRVEYRTDTKIKRQELNKKRSMHEVFEWIEREQYGREYNKEPNNANKFARDLIGEFNQSY